MCQVELRGWRMFGMIFTAARRTVLECMLAPLTPSMVENRRELKPNTAIHVVLLQATREAAECTNPVMMMSVTFSPSPSGSGSKAMYTQVFPLEMLGTNGMEERSPVADRNELVVRGNRFSMTRGFSSVALTAMSMSLSGYSLRMLWDSARRLWVPPPGRSHAQGGIVCAPLRWGLLVPLLVEILLVGHKLSRGRSWRPFTFFTETLTVGAACPCK